MRIIYRFYHRLDERYLTVGESETYRPDPYGLMGGSERRTNTNIWKYEWDIATEYGISVFGIKVWFGVRG